VVLYRNGEERRVLRKYLGKETHHTVFEAEVIGLTIAVELVRMEGYLDMAEISADSQAALCATKNTRGMPGQYLLDKFQDQLTAAQNRHGASSIELRWTQGHNIIPGNEQADTEVKAVASGDSSPACLLPKSCQCPMPYSRSMEQQNHLKKLGDKSTEFFMASPRCQRLKQIDPSMPSSRFRKATWDLLGCMYAFVHWSAGG